MSQFNGCLQIILTASVLFLSLYLLQGITTGNFLQKTKVCTSNGEEGFNVRDGVGGEVEEEENTFSYNNGGPSNNNTIDTDFDPTDGRKTLNASDLLPSYDSPDPNNLGDKNFLNVPDRFVMINTVSSSLRNANLQLRSEPPNPQVSVCPWMQSTIQPDLERKSLEDCV